jgi:CRISPR-associated endonuclease Csn1
MSENHVVLGLDIGANSIGWALAYETDGETFRDPVAMGVRVFPAGLANYETSKEESLNENRRIKRGMRRQIARRARRKRIVRDALIQVGLFPAGRDAQNAVLDATDPYTLRARAVAEPLEPFELGRIFLHLAQRRGFLSNRKSDGDDKEASETLKQIARLESELGGKTLGQHFAELHADPHVRIRGQRTRRKMYLDEFEAIWAAQSRFRPELLTDTLKYGTTGPVEKYPVEPAPHRKGISPLEKFGLHGLIFFQRPMYWPSKAIGRCELERREKRAPRADRRFQLFRILQEVNHLRIVGPFGEERTLTDDQRRAAIDKLSKSEEVKFDDLRKTLRLAEGETFNLERGDRKKLEGHKTDAKLSHKKYFGPKWHDMTEDRKNAIAATLADPKIDEDAIRAIATAEWNCPAELAEALTKVRLPDGYASFSLKAIEKLLPHLQRGLVLMANDETDSALHAAGYLRRDELLGEARKTLPPVPEDITNPLVRQALREVRKLVHAIIRKYGHPGAIHLEMARDLKANSFQRAKSNKSMRLREARREAAAEAIRSLGFRPSRESITRYLIWQEQGEACLYSGRHISPQQLFSESNAVEVDHILPYSRSLDDSQANKAVCLHKENQAKGDRTPYEWFGESDPAKYEAIIQRAARQPMEVRKGRLDRIRQKQIRLDDFVARQLVDTAYIARKVREFLVHLGVKVVCVKGGHTGQLRHLWGLNSLLNPAGLELKSREDHRHHAVDALVVAMTTPRTLQSLAWYRKLRSEHARDNLSKARLETPCEDFRPKVEYLLDRIVVSHKSKRKIAGALHEETLYGPTHKPDQGAPGPRGHARDWTEEEGTFVLRKSLESLNCGEVLRIRDQQVRSLVIARLAEHGIDPERDKKIPGEVWKEPLRMTGKRGAEKSPNAPIIRSVRILKKDETIRPIRGGLAWVKPGNTHHICLFEIPGRNGKKDTRDMVSVSMIEAVKRVRAGLPLISRVHPDRPDARFLFSLSWGETVRGKVGTKEGIFIYKFSSSVTKQMIFASHLDARPSTTQVEFRVRPNTLDFEKITVDRLGQIRDAHD